MKFLGLARWRREIQNEIDTLSTQVEEDSETRIGQVGQIYFTLEKRERVEILSLLEVFLWKTKIAEAVLMMEDQGEHESARKKSKIDDSRSVGSAQRTVDRQGCRVNCGADVNRTPQRLWSD